MTELTEFPSPREEIVDGKVVAIYMHEVSEENIPEGHRIIKASTGNPPKVVTAYMQDYKDLDAMVAALGKKTTYDLAIRHLIVDAQKILRAFLDKGDVEGIVNFHDIYTPFMSTSRQPQTAETVMSSAKSMTLDEKKAYIDMLMPSASPKQKAEALANLG